MTSALLAAWLAADAVAARADKAGAKPTQTIQEAYDQAFRLYQAGNYRKAIGKWTEILRYDPDQASARKMIDQARKEIVQQTRKKRERVRELIGRGRYSAADLELQSLIDLDPFDGQLQTLHTRLGEVAEVVKATPEDGGKAWRVAARGLTGYLGVPLDLKLAHNGLRYAAELDGREPAFGKLLDVVRNRYPQVGEDDVTPGMKLMQHKHLVALHHIYDARYHAAVSVLREILQLEPDDLTALKQLGSAYFSLGLKPQARDAWTRALKLTPDDPALKEFLRKV